MPGDISETFIEFILSTSGKHTKTTEPKEVRRGSKQAYCSLPSEKRFLPHIAVMLQKSILGCQTGQNAISVQSVREITLAEASATVPWDCSSPSARECRVNAFPTSLIPEQRSIRQATPSEIPDNMKKDNSLIISLCADRSNCLFPLLWPFSCLISRTGHLCVMVFVDH